MALFFTVTLGISIAGMLALLMLKRHELTSGRIFLGAARPAIGNFFHQKVLWVEHVLPGLLRVGAKRTYVFVRRVARVWAMRAAAALEYRLEQALSRVRQRQQAPPRRSGQETSAFLRQVSEHKEKAKSDMPEKGIVLEE